MRRLTAVMAAALAVLPLASCSGGGGDDDTFVLSVRGRAEVLSPGPVQRLGKGRHQLVVGQTVRVTTGSAVLGLPGDSSLELRAGRQAAADSTVKVAARPTIVDGDALAVAGDDRLRFAAGGATVALEDGAARIRRSSGVTLAVYEGKAEVEALGRRMTQPVRAYRQVAVADSGALPRRAAPLVYDRSAPDPWDVRYLQPAIDLGAQLDRRSRTLTSELAVPSPAPAYLESIVPALARASGFGADLVDAGRSVGETVVGASIALGGSGDFVRRWTDAFEFREQGAEWGLVAFDQRAARASVLDVLDGVLGNVSPRFSTVAVGTGGVLPAFPTSAPDGPGSPAGSPLSPSSPTRPGSGSPSPSTPPPTPVLPPVTVPPPVSPLLPPLVGPLVPSPTPTEPSPTSPSGVVGGVTGAVGGLLGGTSGGDSGGTSDPVPVVGGLLDTTGGALGSLLGGG